MASRDSVSFAGMEGPSGHEIGGFLHFSEGCVVQELTFYPFSTTCPEYLVLNLNFHAKLEEVSVALFVALILDFSVEGDTIILE